MPNFKELEDLSGLFGHTFSEGSPDYQFQIVDEYGPHSYEVQLHSWIDGRPNEKAIMATSYLKSDAVHLYGSDYEMRRACDDLMAEHITADCNSEEMPLIGDAKEAVKSIMYFATH